MEKLKTVAIPENLYEKLWAIAHARKPRIPLKTLVIEILSKGVGKP